MHLQLSDAKPTSTSALANATTTSTIPPAANKKKHERRKSSMQSSPLRSASGHVRRTSKPGSGAAHAADASPQVHGNGLGIEATVTVGPVPTKIRGKRARGPPEMGRRFALNTTFLNSPGSPRTPLSAKPSTCFDEIFNGALLPLPFLAAGLAFPSEHSPFEARQRTPAGANTADYQHMLQEFDEYQHFIHAGALSAAALLLIGTIARLRLSDSVLDRRKASISITARKSAHAHNSQTGLSLITSVASRTLSLALPFYSAVQLGGVRVSLVLLLSIGTGLSNLNTRAGILERLAARKEAVALLLALVFVDSLGLLGNYQIRDLALGYLTLVTSAFAIQPPIPYLDRLLGRSMPIITTRTPVPSVGPTPPTSPRPSGSPSKGTPISKVADANTSIAAGLILGAITCAASYGLSIPLKLSLAHFGLSLLALAAMSCLSFFALPVTIGSRGRPGLAVGLLLVACFAVMHSHHVYPDSILIPSCFVLFCIANYFVALKHSAPDFGHFKESSSKRIGKDGQKYSLVTGYLLSYCAPGSMLDTILSEKDSRRVAYFGCLNLAFMLVQFFYGFATGSLGLLTDSIHMLFDCLGLGVGLAAAVMSKWPPSLAFPYGYGKVNPLSGFANGIFLILVSVEIVMDAIHRIHDGHELRRLNELLVVSIAGFVVNIVGLTVFGHAHHGHGHSHSHSHAHSHSNTHEHAAHVHNHANANGHTDHGHQEHKHENHDHAHTDGYMSPKKKTLTPSSYADMPPTPFSIPSLPPPTPLPPSSTSPTHQTHNHAHHNENMQGIYLHILGDTLGSAAVIFSTLLTKYNKWNGWDPLASVAIAAFIFASAIPLVKSSAGKLMLGLPDSAEYECREGLQGLGELRGVSGVGGVRVWVGDEDEGGGHGHGHGHGHHYHDHDHGCEGTIARMMGVVHVVAASGADVEDVAERASLYLKGRGMDLLVHVEREGSSCWCGNGKGGG